ncbi:MAG: histone deacetylase [Chloroflexi bacterium]|nr:histone deacetylase [Chloroflexota bacterium]
MNIYAVPSPEHNDPTHPENAARIPAVLAVVNSIQHSALSIQRSALSPATDSQLALVHHPDYIDALRAAMADAPAYIDTAPTYVTPQSFHCAALAAAGAMAAVQSILPEPAAVQASHLPPPTSHLPPPTSHLPPPTSHLPPPTSHLHSSFALIRPPGHHAPPGHAMGFCLFNNVALAARHAQQRGLSRIMIVDFDVHHGNGTQDAFYSDPSVLFISTHQWGIYPGTGRADEVGAGAGRGYTVNVPLAAGAGDATFGRIAADILWPAADRFQPELLLVSAGYDAHWRDPLAGLQLSCAGYHALAGQLAAIAKRHCGGRIVFVLEGGYDLPALSHGVANTIRGALGLPVEDPLGPAPRPESVAGPMLDQVRHLHGL